jgi:hypothetical protein
MDDYGHSRLREFVLGGVTRGILSTVKTRMFYARKQMGKLLAAAGV